MLEIEGKAVKERNTLEGGWIGGPDWGKSGPGWMDGTLEDGWRGDPIRRISGKGGRCHFVEKKISKRPVSLSD